MTLLEKDKTKVMYNACTDVLGLANASTLTLGKVLRIKQCTYTQNVDKGPFINDVTIYYDGRGQN